MVFLPKGKGLINRPRVAGAVLQIVPLLIDSVSESLTVVLRTGRSRPVPDLL